MSLRTDLWQRGRDHLELGVTWSCPLRQSQQMPILFASSEKNVQWIKVVTNDSIGKCSSELYIFSLLKLPPPPRAAICYMYILPIGWLFKGYRPCRRPQRPCVHWISIFKLSKCGAIWWWCHVIPGGDMRFHCPACIIWMLPLRFSFFYNRSKKRPVPRGRSGTFGTPKGEEESPST